MLTVFAPEIYGFRWKSAARVKNTADRGKHPNLQQMPKIHGFHEFHEFEIWSSQIDYCNYYCYVLCRRFHSSAFCCSCFIPKLRFVYYIHIVCFMVYILMLCPCLVYLPLILFILHLSLHVWYYTHSCVLWVLLFKCNAFAKILIIYYVLLVKRLLRQCCVRCWQWLVSVCRWRKT